MPRDELVGVADAGGSDAVQAAATYVDAEGAVHVYVPVEIEVRRDPQAVDVHALVQAALDELVRGLNA